jgi:hypothetical protein
MSDKRQDDARALWVGEEDLAGFGVVTDDEACCGANIGEKSRLL